MKIALTGASGFIGHALSERLRGAGHEVVPVRIREMQSVPPSDAVVHLAGETVGQRWTPEAKRRIRESRADGTRRLVAELAKLERPPRVLISASAVGFYGSRGDEALTEASAPGSGFLAEIGAEWEQAACAAAALGTRVVLLRFGVVLGRGGGTLVRMLPAYKLGLGGRMGDGRQWLSWIHMEDALRLVEFTLAAGGLAGPVNATAPNPVTNAEFTRALASALHRPAFLPAPAFALRLLLGEMAGLVLDSQRVLPRAALDAGFSFRYPELPAALRSLLA